MSNQAEKIIEQNWEEVKKEMRKTWRNLTEDQVEKINSYDDLVKQLKKSYKISKDNSEEITDKINKFIDKFDLQLNPDRFDELKNALYQSAENAKNKMSEAFNNSKDLIQDKTEDWSKEAINYSKENPLKILGLGILAAVTIKKLINKES
jgi:ElaB/YqjD/DUF883 family membrane-anchored ribosome-binding protein